MPKNCSNKFESRDTPVDVHGETMWPVWKRNQEWRERLAEEATRKALDLPSTGLSIFKNGIGWKELAIIAAIAIGGPLAWSHLMRPQPTTEKPPVVEDKDTNTKYTITIE